MLNEGLDPNLPGLYASLLDLALTPPSRLSLSEWSEANIVLSSEYAAQPFPLKLFGWQKELFDSFTDPSVEDITIMCATQLCKTLFLQCAIAYIICEAPGPILLVEPTDTDAKDYSRERLAPMVRDCECLHGKISSSSHDGSTGSNRLQAKDFPGGNLSIVGAGAPGNLARRTIRYLLLDEVDKYKLDVKGEGDPVRLAWERAATFKSRRRRIMCCTPTILGQSRIGQAYKDSDQRKPLAPCMKCGFPQLLHFFPDERGGGVKFDNTLPRDKKADSAYYQCANCPHQWNDRDRVKSANASTWHPYNPLVKKSRGYWISHLYSPWKKLSGIVQDYLDVKDNTPAYKTFINTNLAIEWAETGETPDAEKLYANREDYPFGSEAVIPSRGLFLTAAVDVQDNPPRLEVEVKAWGRGRESWSMYYDRIECFDSGGQALSVTNTALWDKLDREVLQRSWKHASGHLLSIRAMCIDTGSRPKPVYEFARKHPQLSYSAGGGGMGTGGGGGKGIRLHAVRTVIPCKGNADQYRIISSISDDEAARSRKGVRILVIGTHCAKQEIYDGLKSIRLSRTPEGRVVDEPVAGLSHFPLYDMPFFNMLCSEVRVLKENGKVEYQVRGPNHTLDLHVYNRTAASVVGIDRFGEAQWRQLEEAVGTPVLSSESTPLVPAYVVSTLPSSVSVEVGASGEPGTPTSSPAPTPSPSPAPKPNLGPSQSALRPRPVRGGFL